MAFCLIKHGKKFTLHIQSRIICIDGIKIIYIAANMTTFIYLWK
jgi:hypothetical protein